MSKFEEVCLLSCESWIDSFPNEVKEHKFSEKHNKKMREILQTEKKTYKYQLSKKTIKVLLIAAILLSLSLTVFAISASKKFIIEKFLNHSEYNVADTSNIKEITPLRINYIPDGFKKEEKYKSDSFYIEFYKNNNKYFYVKKYLLNTNIGYDTEKYDSQNIKINEKEAIYYVTDTGESGIIFNDGEFIFSINGNIGKEELVNIAQDIQ